MRWSPLFSIVIGLMIAGGRLLSQETSTEPDCDAPCNCPASLLRETTAVHFRLILGRIELDGVRYRKGTHHRQSTLGGNDRLCRESLSIDAVGGIPSVRYLRQSPDQSLTLDVNGRGRLQIDSVDVVDNSRVVITQESGRPISVRRINGDQVAEYSVATWFHLSVADPSLYQQHFEPLVDDLLYPLRLRDLALQAHDYSLAELFGNRGSKADDAPTAGVTASQLDTPTLHQWIAELGSTGRAERIEALRRLHDQGLSLLPRLQQVDRRTLDAEQRERLAQLIRQLTPRGDDYAARVAALIRDDPSYWAAAADHLSEQEQRLIAARLQSLAMPISVRLATMPSADTPSRR